MRQTVTVTAGGALATVSYDRPTACHGDCDSCGGCASMAAKEQITVQAENPIGAKPGDRVVIEAATGQVFSAVLLVYALPVVLFFLGYFLGAAMFGTGALCGGTGFVLGLLAAVVAGRKTKVQFRIVSFAK